MLVLHSHKRGFSTSNFKCLLRLTVLTNFIFLQRRGLHFDANVCTNKTLAEKGC